MVVFLLLIFMFLFLFLIHYFMVVANLPPGPTMWQLWRRRHAFATKPHVATKELADTYGPLLSFRLGGQLVVVASSPAAAEEILKTNNLAFSGRYMPSVFYNIPGTKHGSIAVSRECDAAWKSLRSIGHKFIFSPAAVESAASIRKAKAKEMIEFLQGGGRAVDIEHLLCAVFTNIIMNVLASRNLFDAGGESESDRNMTRFLNDMVKKATIPGLGDVFPILRGIDFWTKGKGLEFYKSVQLIWGDIVRERRGKSDSNLESKQDFLDVLNGYSFDHDQICSILMELILAATDSTTITAVWLMAELMKNEEILHKVGNEIAEIAVDGDELNESWLSRCSYFEACIKETLRLHIPGPFAIPHRAIESCKVSNYVIPRDSIVVVNSWMIQTDPNVWDDAAVFNPERFLGSKIDFKGAHCEYLPFSAGKRMCPGFNVAFKGLMFVVASLLYHFDWSLPHGENPNELDMSDEFGTSLKMAKPLHLIPKLRDRSNFSDMQNADDPPPSVDNPSVIPKY